MALQRESRAARSRERPNSGRHIFDLVVGLVVVGTVFALGFLVGGGVTAISLASGVAVAVFGSVGMAWRRRPGADSPPPRRG